MLELRSPPARPDAPRRSCPRARRRRQPGRLEDPLGGPASSGSRHSCSAGTSPAWSRRSASGVTRFELGDAVFGMPLFPRAGGGYAEYVVAPSRHFAARPRPCGRRRPPRCRCAGLTAWQALVETADVQPGGRVLVLESLQLLDLTEEARHHGHRAGTEPVRQGREPRRADLPRHRPPRDPRPQRLDVAARRLRRRPPDRRPGATCCRPTPRSRPCYAYAKEKGVGEIEDFALDLAPALRRRHRAGRGRADRGRGVRLGAGRRSTEGAQPHAGCARARRPARRS